MVKKMKDVNGIYQITIILNVQYVDYVQIQNVMVQLLKNVVDIQLEN